MPLHCSRRRTQMHTVNDSGEDSERVIQHFAHAADLHGKTPRTSEVSPPSCFLSATASTHSSFERLVSHFRGRFLFCCPSVDFERRHLFLSNVFSSISTEAPRAVTAASPFWAPPRPCLCIWEGSKQLLFSGAHHLQPQGQFFPRHHLWAVPSWSPLGIYHNSGCDCVQHRTLGVHMILRYRSPEATCVSSQMHQSCGTPEEPLTGRERLSWLRVVSGDASPS